MRWRLALFAEILARLHDPSAEEPFPKTIHGHAGGEWIVRPDQPPGQSEAIGRLIVRQRR